ncbi:MAG: alpha/beta hydrolase, partial [Lachnospiraceae bacterium]|nr:alpha/beta hydrolase [Lachnospiraceae bacterium]
FENISYGPDRMNVLDIYRPNRNETKLPVIVSVHGGGWVYGDKKVYRHYCLDLAKRGFVVVNFTYRLAPKHKYPAHLEDTVRVFNWIQKNTGRYGMDEKNIFAVGDSAGAHILSTYCAMCTNPEYGKTYDFISDNNFLPKAIALNCGVYDMELVKLGTSDTMALMKDVLRNGGTEEELRWVSSILHMKEGFPPTYIMTANGDFLKEQALPLKEKLDTLGTLCTLKIYGDETEELGHVFHLNMYHATGRKCNDEECAFFRGFM